MIGVKAGWKNGRFYIRWEATHRVDGDLEGLSGDCRAVDTTCDARNIWKNSSTLKTGKQDNPQELGENRYTDCYEEIRLLRLEEGWYRVVEAGTGMVGMGLDPVEGEP